MGLHIVAGSGPVGSVIATELRDRGERVVMVTRSGSGVDGVEKVAADVSDADRFARLSRGADVVYNAVNPPYHRWPELWPPMAASFLRAAEDNEAVLAVVDSLYAFGPVDGPMRQSTPDRPSSIKGGIRKRMWEEALAAQAAGRIRGAVSVRGSDYVGAGPSVLSLLVLPRALDGKRAFVPATLDAPHTWTNPADAARLLVRAAADERSHGAAWLVPSAPACSVRELSSRACAIAGAPSPRLSSMPLWMLRATGLVNVWAKELAEMNYQFRRPFTLDTSETDALLGGEFTPLDESIRSNIEPLLAGRQPAAA